MGRWKSGVDCSLRVERWSFRGAPRKPDGWAGEEPEDHKCYEYFRVTRANDSVENYTDLFTVVLRNDDIQGLDSKWDEIQLSMTQIPSDHILESLYKLRTQVWETQDRIGIVQYGDSSEESWTWSSQIEDNSKNKYRAAFENEEFWGQKWKFWNKRRGQESKDETAWSKKSRRLLAMESSRAVFKRRDNWSFRHDMNKRAKSTQPNPSPRSSTQQSVKNASWNEKSWRQKPKWKMAVQGLPQRNLHHSILWKSGILQSACSTSQKMDADSGKSALMHTARLMNSPAKGLKRMVTKVQWLHWKLHDNWVAYFKIWSRRSLQRFCGWAQTYWSQADVFDSLKPCYVMLTFETKIHRVEWFAQVIFISVTPMLQNLRIGLKKRRNGKSDVPVKQRGGSPNISWN